MRPPLCVCGWPPEARPGRLQVTGRLLDSAWQRVQIPPRIRIADLLVVPIGTDCCVLCVQIVHLRGQSGRWGRSGTDLHRKLFGWGPKGREFKSRRLDYTEAPARRSGLSAFPRTWRVTPASGRRGGKQRRNPPGPRPIRRRAPSPLRTRLGTTARRCPSAPDPAPPALGIPWRNSRASSRRLKLRDVAKFSPRRSKSPDGGRFSLPAGGQFSPGGRDLSAGQCAGDTGTWAGRGLVAAAAQELVDQDAGHGSSDRAHGARSNQRRLLPAQPLGNDALDQTHTSSVPA